LLEQAYTPIELQAFQNKYCMKLPPKNPGEDERVILMVIKKVPSTKAMVSRKSRSLLKANLI
jgi:hypothetical protein